jgi:hypothetical protein
MGIGRSTAATYVSPQVTPQAQAPIVEAPQPSGIPVPEGLEWVDGQTQNIYRKWGQINNFAKIMKTQYGIDVTNPDVTDPYQVQIAQAHQKGIADLYMNIDKFRNSQAMLQDFNRRGGQFSEAYDRDKTFAEQIDVVEKQEIEKETLDVLADFQRAFTDEATAGAATKELETYRDTLVERYKVATNPTTKNMLQRSINAVKGALYDSTADKDRWQRGRQQRRENIERDEQIRTAAHTLSQIQGGNTSVFGGFTDKTKGGRQVFDMESIVMEPSGKISFKTNEYQYVDEDNKVHTVPADDQTFNVGSDGFKRYMTTLMRNLEGFNELTFANLRESPYYTGGGGFEQDVPYGTGSPKPDVDLTNEEIDKAMTNESALARLSGSDDKETFDGLVRQLNTQAKSNEQLTLPKGVPMREFAIVSERWPDLNKEGKLSSGNETISKVEWFRNGIQFIDTEGNEWYLPLASKAVKGLGDYSHILADVFSRNNMDVSKQLPKKYYKKAEPEKTTGKKVAEPTVESDTTQVSDEFADLKRK